MTEEIKRILDTLTENYDDIGSSYYPEDVFNHKDPKILYDYIIQLQKENKELHNKIDKAINYIKEQGCYDEDCNVFCTDLNYYAMPRLLEILEKDSDVDG